LKVGLNTDNGRNAEFLNASYINSNNLRGVNGRLVLHNTSDCHSILKVAWVKQRVTNNSTDGNMVRSAGEWQSSEIRSITNSHISINGNQQSLISAVLLPRVSNPMHSDGPKHMPCIEYITDT